jgi:hypothetical protein
MGKLISFLIPTRERTELLISSMNLLIDNAVKPEELEFLIKFDTDDIKSIAEFLSNDICKIIDYKVLITDRKGGYADLYIDINDLCRMATGEFLMLYNDDAFMTTPRWDDHVRKHSGKFCVLWPHSGNRIHNCFPIVHRKYFEILGHFSLQTHNDTWVEEVSRKAGIEIDTPEIFIRHIKNRNYRQLYRTDEFYQMEDLRKKDVETIKQYNFLSKG